MERARRGDAIAEVETGEVCFENGGRPQKLKHDRHPLEAEKRKGDGLSLQSFHRETARKRP